MAAPDDLTPEEAVARSLAKFDPGAPVGVAVSGGGDSLALLLATHAQCATSRRIFAATVDHGLRAGAADEAREVARICEDVGVPHDTLSLGLTDGADLQARARIARYGALREWARARGIGPVLVGHTQNDVAESLVMRLRRGVGLDGLSEMPRQWRDDEGQHWARPFLDLSRDTLRDYLAHTGVTPLEDPSNEDSRFERVEIRKALQTLGWDATNLARSARHLARAAQAYDMRLFALFDEMFTESHGDLLFDQAFAAGLASAEPDSLRRLLLGALTTIGSGRPIRETEQARLMAYVRTSDSPGVTLGGCQILREGPVIRICREVSACDPPVPFGTIWDGRWEVTGPTSLDLSVGALADDVEMTPWRDSPLPRASAMAQPAVRQGKTLLAAPTLGHPGAYRAVNHADPRAAFRRRQPFFN